MLKARSAAVLRTFLRREEVEADLELEMRTHVELEAEELVRQGIDPAEARRLAAAAFGGVQRVKEEAIERSSVAWFTSLRRDVRIAWRGLKRYPTFAVTTTLALALAIAVNTTMFSVLDAMMNPATGVRAPEQLYGLRYFGDPKAKVDFREADQAIAAAGHLFGGQSTGFARGGESVERGARIIDTPVLVVRTNFFAVLGTTPLAGKLAPGNDEQSVMHSVVISDRLASNLFSRGETPLGGEILVEGKALTVIGVVARAPGGGMLDYDAWRFIPPSAPAYSRMIRLGDGMTLAHAEQRLKVLAAQLAAAAGDATKDTRFHLTPMVRQFHAARFHFALIGAGIAILLVACTNLANLQLARGLGRAPELALRSSLGASRRQIIAQLLIESGIIALIALGLALVFTVAGNNILRATVPPSLGEYVIEPQSSWRMVVFAGIASVVCLVAIGLIPALRVSNVDLNTLLKSGAGTGAHKSNRRVYGALVIVQIAFTLPLICAAVLTTRAAWRAADRSTLIRDMLGYDPAPVLSAVVRIPHDTSVAYRVAEEHAALISRARAVPGVVNAATNSMMGASAITTDVPGGGYRETPTPMWSYQVVSPSYFRTLDIPIVEGRDFTEGGHDEPQIIMDRETANRLWPGQSPIGRLLRFGDAKSPAPFYRVQGIMQDRLSDEARDQRRLNRQSRLGAVYRVVSLSDSAVKAKYPMTVAMMTIRAPVQPSRVAAALRKALQIGDVPPPQVGLQEDYLGIRKTKVVRRFVAALFTTFGILALGLSALGVYAIVAQSVADRRREVAVRMSLGASPKRIVHTLLREGNVLVLGGVAIGLFMAKQTIGWLALFLGDVDLTNAPLFAAICVALFAAMVGAALLPAMKATRLDPMNELRAD